MPRKNQMKQRKQISVLIASMRPRPDAAEKLSVLQDTYGRYLGFNEAAARCRGKTRRGSWGQRTIQVASMRPRPDAAEKQGRSP